MAMPHDVKKKEIKKRLTGLFGKARVKEIRIIINELAGYKSAHYGKIRKDLLEEIERTKTRSKVVSHDIFEVERHGNKQFCLVGAPSSGKSSLLVNLSKRDIKIGSYDFTTLKPIPAVVILNGAQIQIIDLPGLIEGAVEDKGSGRRLLGIVKNTDGIIFMVDLTKDCSEALKIYNEIIKANIKLPIIFVGNKVDSPLAKGNIKKVKNKFKGIILISVNTEEGIEELKKEIWKKSGLIRVYTEDSKEPTILKKGSNIEDLANKIHHELAEKFKFAIINGKSAKFPDQRVGLDHKLEDEDRVEISSQI